MPLSIARDIHVSSTRFTITMLRSKGIPHR